MRDARPRGTLDSSVVDQSPMLRRLAHTAHAASPAGPGRATVPSPRSETASERSATYRRWFVATTLGELVAFSLPTGVWAATAVAGLDERIALAPVILAGAGEGAVLAYAQSRALRRELPDFDTSAWIRATAAAAALSWAVGMMPSTFHEPLSALPPPVVIVFGLAGGVVMLCSIGVAQAAVLRRYVEHAGRWITANALGWLAGLPVVFAALAVAPEHPAAVRVAFALVGAVGMGAAVAAVTGSCLVRLLGHRRPALSRGMRRPGPQ
jgi:hypothetical protein